MPTLDSARSERRNIWRFPQRWFQFSLRTLLALVTLAAITCWWWLLPESQDEVFAQGELRVRKDVRQLEALDPAERAKVASSWEWRPMTLGQANIYHHGRWQLSTRDSERLVDGHFEKNQPHGLWTSYHPNGQIAIQGMMHHGAKAGVWRTWNEKGQLTSEATYAVVKRPRILVGMGIPASTVDSYVSLRHGPAGAWHSNGMPKMLGSYQGDRRDGEWTFADEQGRVVAQGVYRAGRREGKWRYRDRETGDAYEVQSIPPTSR